MLIDENRVSIRVLGDEAGRCAIAGCANRRAAQAYPRGVRHFSRSFETKRPVALCEARLPNVFERERMTEKPNVTLPGKVEKIIEPAGPSEPEKAEISVEGADPLYQEIRIENSLTDENGDEVRLKKGAQVEVTGIGLPVCSPQSRVPLFRSISDTLAERSFFFVVFLVPVL